MNKQLEQATNNLYKAITDSEAYHKVIQSEQVIANHPTIIEHIKNLKNLQKESLKIDSITIQKKQDDLFYKLQNEPEYIEYLNNVDELNQIVKHVNQTINNYFEELTKL